MRERERRERGGEREGGERELLFIYILLMGVMYVLKNEWRKKEMWRKVK